MVKHQKTSKYYAIDCRSPLELFSFIDNFSKCFIVVYVLMILKTKWLFFIKLVVVITIAQLHSTKLQVRFSTGSNPARSIPEIRDGEDLWQLPRLEIRLKSFRRSTIPQKQFIIIINFFIIYKSTSSIFCCSWCTNKSLIFR